MKATIFNIQKFSLHDGSGIRTTVFFKGCGLRCKWCANPESYSVEPDFMDGERIGRVYSIDEIIDEILKDKPFFDNTGGGATLSGGEPLMQWEFVTALCEKLRINGITVGIETSAYRGGDIFAAVIGKCDFAYIDLKHWDEDMHMRGTSVSNRQILENISYAFTVGIPVTIRIPLIPEYNNSEKDAREFGLLLNKLGAKEIHILPFHQLGENKYRKLGFNYDFSGVSQLHKEDALSFAGILASFGLQVQIGG